jgi:hypothetical protein
MAERCEVCNVPDGKRLHALTDHHHNWPKNKRGAKRGQYIHRVCRACHNTGPNAYHQFYTHNCQKRSDRICVGCRFARICCYAN